MIRSTCYHKPTMAAVLRRCETHRKSLLKGQRNAHEKELSHQTQADPAEGIFVTVVADRGLVTWSCSSAWNKS